MERYRAFLLTCWFEQDGGKAGSEWRFRLEEPRSSEQVGFDKLESLCAFLEKSLYDANIDEHSERPTKHA
ncbi:MAG: hypothetical protein ACK2T3_16690 [Candidatus Promineifilaceae bacterium]|jgi:hypothetical protein